MASVEIASLRKENPKWSKLDDREFAKTYVNEKNKKFSHPIHIIIRYKRTKDGEYTMFSLCTTWIEANAVFASPSCYDPEIIYNDLRAPA